MRGSPRKKSRVVQPYRDMVCHPYRGAATCAHWFRNRHSSFLEDSHRSRFARPDGFPPPLRRVGSATVLRLSSHPAIRCFLASVCRACRNTESTRLRHEDNWRAALDLVERAKYNRDNYTRLEAMFKAQGYDDRADTVHAAMVRRDRDETMGTKIPGYLGRTSRIWRRGEWLFSWSWGLLTGNSRSPSRTLILGAIVIVLGWIRFSISRNRFVPRGDGDNNMPFSPFWYSLDLFVPAINLQAADAWMPSGDWGFGRNYIRWHRIAGWILVPIWLLTLTGLFSR
jgi:hypothetical protein